MNVTINGKKEQIPGTIKHVRDLLSHFQLERRNLIVLVNENVITPEQHDSTFIRDGDTIELVHFVGGG
ncbi:sulfur carrier protein ThiS [Microaerobacter geothermalis]|uniref:sulfur carrier protein ThiS n=1 Tax=Microaerobacter geothermalis TaxID=674972 RepID=UPI001F22F9CC|nr:sulfur carrier protein ThiS [Microaerobacter geothermalis]MCF6094609.1 sulfur carrier protein ThiS [Microaerobacter geothermalis]